MHSTVVLYICIVIVSLALIVLQNGEYLGYFCAPEKGCRPLQSEGVVDQRDETGLGIATRPHFIGSSTRYGHTRDEMNINYTFSQKGVKAMRVHDEFDLDIRL